MVQPMPMHVRVNGRPLRNPIVRALWFVVVLSIAVAVLAVAAAVVIPLAGLALIVGALGIGGYLLSAPFRRRVRHEAKPEAKADGPTVEILDDNARLDRAKPVERV